LGENFQNIIQEIKSGNDDILNSLYEQYRNEFIAFSAKNFNTQNEQSKDAFQEAILDFYQNIITGKLLELTSSAKTYLFQIGRNKVLNILKKEQRLIYLEDLQLIKGQEYESFVEEDEVAFTQEQIQSIISEMAADCQKVLKLYYFNEYDMESIAVEMNYKNANTAKSKKSLCMKKLISKLNELKEKMYL
jgi:RNA polymerase sigma factor (sigma-70 family)